MKKVSVKKFFDDSFIVLFMLGWNWELGSTGFAQNSKDPEPCVGLGIAKRQLQPRSTESEFEF